MIFTHLVINAIGCKAVELKNDLQNENFAVIHEQPCNLYITPSLKYTTARLVFMIKEHI